MPALCYFYSGLKKKKVSPVICGSPGDVKVLENNQCDQGEGTRFVVLLLKCTTELFSDVRFSLGKLQVNLLFFLPSALPWEA